MLMVKSGLIAQSQMIAVMLIEGSDFYLQFYLIHSDTHIF